MADQTPLHHAAHNGNTELAELLIRQNANINAVDATGHTPLHEAAAAGQEKMAALLLEHGADVNAQSQHRGQVLSYIVGDPLSPESRSETPLHQAAQSGSAETIRVLLKNGASLEARDGDGQTPLHWVASELNFQKDFLNAGFDRAADVKQLQDTAQVLIQGGADVNARDRKGISPADILPELLETGKTPAISAQQAMETALGQFRAGHMPKSEIDPGEVRAPAVPKIHISQQPER